jgi:hypothetical protein
MSPVRSGDATLRLLAHTARRPRSEFSAQKPPDSSPSSEPPDEQGHPRLQDYGHLENHTIQQEHGALLCDGQRLPRKLHARQSRLQAKGT